jgi:hypothetical protein
MTLLASWIGVDTHGIASAYIAADSRISWGNAGIFDHGRKVFAFRNSPDILGYCGDVLFPSIVLGQIVEMADRGLLFRSDATCKDRFEGIKKTLVQQFRRYPHMVKEIAADILQVLHISRDPNDNTHFSCWLMEWGREAGWSREEFALPQRSGILKVLGSGGSEFQANLTRYQNGPDHGTSRCVFHCFCDTLFNINDNGCGGAPQLVGIYRKPDSPGITYGVIKDGKRYFLGAFVGNSVSHDGVEWRNDLFERCDGTTMKRKDGAQKQPDVLRRQ